MLNVSASMTPTKEAPTNSSTKLTSVSESEVDGQNTEKR